MLAQATASFLGMVIIDRLPGSGLQAPEGHPHVCKKSRLDRSPDMRMFRMTDPRLYQIATLASLLAYGMGWLDFGVTSSRVCIVLLTVLATQAVCDRLNGASVNVKSALISGLSLCLLLRTNWTELAVLAAVIAIVSKFVIRFRGKHIFNPTNGGLVAMLLLTDQVWVSPGQWGSVAFFAILMASVGGLVVNRAARADVTYAFIAFYCALMFGRSIYLGEPLTIPFHRLESGALLLFTFFMISDPKTTPSSRTGRVLFAGLVAFSAWYVQFRLFRTNGLLWSLAAWSLAVPLIDWLLPGSRYSWSSPRATTFPARLEQFPLVRSVRLQADLLTVRLKPETTYK
jgi:Na+-transporting NADH:ubiquinone oxidoreductase subunit NqrB